MAADTFRTVSSESWFSRLAGSIKSVLVGIVLFLVAFPLLIWNEGRAVQTAKSLREGASHVVSVPPDGVDAAHEGQLVHLTGEAATADTLSDATFGVSAPAIKLVRKAEMYQWKESSKSETRTKLGGGSETVTTYTYKSEWSPTLIDSGSFKEGEGHQNPREMPVAGKTWTARKVTLGAFTLSSAQVNLIDRSEPLAAEDSHPAELPRRAKFEDGGYYLGGDSSTPVVGDERITFQVVRPGTISVIGRQVGDSFEPYHAEAGDDILMVNDGTVSAASMFTAAQEANTQLAWILRGAGFLLMALGLGLIFSPLSVMADVVPLFGTLLRSGTFLFAITIAASLSLITVALSWLAYRPLLGGGLLVAAGAGVFVLHRMGSARKT